MGDAASLRSLPRFCIEEFHQFFFSESMGAGFQLCIRPTVSGSACRSGSTGRSHEPELRGCRRSLERGGVAAIHFLARPWNALTTQTHQPSAPPKGLQRQYGYTPPAGGSRCRRCIWPTTTHMDGEGRLGLSGALLGRSRRAAQTCDSLCDPPDARTRFGHGWLSSVCVPDHRGLCRGAGLGLRGVRVFRGGGRVPAPRDATDRGSTPHDGVQHPGPGREPRDPAQQHAMARQPGLHHGRSFGIPPAIYLLHHADTWIFRVGFGLFLATYAAYMFFGPKPTTCAMCTAASATPPSASRADWSAA